MIIPPSLSKAGFTGKSIQPNPLWATDLPVSEVISRGALVLYNVFDRKDVECGKIIDPAYANLPRPECFSRSRDQLSALLFRLIMIDQSAYDS